MATFNSRRRRPAADDEPWRTGNRSGAVQWLPPEAASASEDGRREGDFCLEVIEVWTTDGHILQIWKSPATQLTREGREGLSAL
jgi:hypothetical protein